MPKFKITHWAKKGISSWWTYWRESLNAGQEKHDFMLYTLVTIVIILSGILIFSGIPLPDLDFSDPVPHKMLVVFEIGFVTWILLYLPYKRHKAEKEEHSEELLQLEAIKNQDVNWLKEQLSKYTDILPIGMELIQGRACHIKLSNPNPVAVQIHFKLLKIEPPLYMNPTIPNGFSTEMVCLSGGYFAMQDTTGECLGPKDDGTIVLFELMKVRQQDEKHALFLKGVWNGRETHHFMPENEHVFTFSVAADYIDTARYAFRFKFDSNGSFSADKLL